MGTPAFACPALVALAKSSHTISCVVTGTDQKVGRGKKIMPSEVAIKADELNLPVIKTDSLKDHDLYDKLAKLDADLIVVIAFRILPRKLFELPNFGSINIHGSLLPKYRGAAPINWALINGEKETGLSAFFLKSKVDTGDIIARTKIDIEPKENFDSLYNRMADLSAPFLIETLNKVESGDFETISQDDKLATPAPKLTPFDAMIDFGFPAENVVNFIRGMSSKPGAYTFFRGKKLKIIAADIADYDGDLTGRPGTILHNRKKIIVLCANSAIELTRVIPEGKKEMDGASFVNGFKPEAGEIIGEPNQ